MSDINFIWQTRAYFLHLFLTLEWYLMAWADNCSNSHVNHIEWRDYFMIILFFSSKGCQEGLISNEPCCIYFNPMCSETFPVIALEICFDVSCFIKRWLSLVYMVFTIQPFYELFLASFRRIGMNFMPWMLIYTTLDITIPVKVLPHCAHLYAPWHNPSPLFVSMYYGWW